MKKLSFFLMAMLFSVMSFADTYTHTFKSGELKVGTVTLSGVSWTGAGTVEYWGWDSNNGKGLQIGSSSKPCKAYSLTTSGFEGKITEVVVNTSMASSGTAKLSISVGGTSYLSNKALTTTATNYTATGEASGDLVISYTNTAKAFYIKSISVTYVVEENPDAVKYTVTANVNDPAMGTVSGAGEIEEGKTATLTANANAGYKFVNWSNGSTDNPLKITVTENVEITANFEVIPTMTCAEAAAAPKDAVVVLNPFDVVYVVKGAGYIYIKDESGVNLIFDYTMDDQLKAGDHVEGFVGVSSPYNGLPELKPSVAFADLKVTPGTTHEATVFETVPTQEDVNKYVVFKGVKLTSNISYTTASATNATISVGGKNVTLRNAFKLAASLTSGSTYDIYAFVAVYNGGIQVYYASSVDVSPERTITATVNPAETGTVTGAGTYKEGKTATLTATPAEGYAFTCWTEGEDTVSTAANYSFKVAADRALVANFAKKTYNVTVTAENGTVTGAGEYEEGKEATLTATANEGYEFTCWTSGEDTVSTANPYTFAVTANLALVANFNKKAEPATETVYFINTKKWANVTAHAWGAKLPDTAWPGLATVKEAEQIAGYDVYSLTVNVGDYANVIFNNKGGGSQTPDLVWTAGKYYVMDMGWLTKEEAETKLAAPLPEVWNIVGAAGLMGKDWDLNAAENAMTKQEDGTYKLEKKDITLTAGTYEYKAAKDHAWTVSVPSGDTNQKLTISKSGIYDVTFVLDVTAKKLTATATLKKEAVVIPTVVIAGDMNSWNQTKDKFTMAADSLTATLKTTLTVKNYGFKMIVGGAWLSDAKTITRAANSTKFTGANGGNSTLKADIAGEYLFTWEYATKTLTVTYPELPVEYTVTATVNPAETGTVAGAGKYEEGKEATLTATAAEGYEFTCWTVGEDTVSTANPYKFTVTADLALVANFELIPPTKYNVTVTAENGTVEGAGEYEENAEATLTATAAEGYEFVNWTVGDSIVSTENPYKFTVTADLALVANFKEAVTTITETFDLTTEDTRNMMGTYNVYAGDYILRIFGYMGAGTYQDDPATEEVVEVQLFTPDYEDPLNAVVVVTIDEENNKEVMQVTATSADGKKIYNLTFNIVAPEIQEHVLYITYPTITVEESPMGGVMYIIEEAEAMMDTEDNIVTVGMTILPSMNYAEMSIGDDIYATGEALVSPPFMGEFTIEAILTDDAGNTYNVTVLAQEIKQDIEIVVAETVELNGYNMTFEMQGNMAIVTANVNGIELFFWMTMYSDDNGYGTYFNDAITNVWYGENALTPYGDEHVYSAENLKVSFINDPDAEGNVTLYNFTLYAGDQPTGVDNINTTVAPVKVIENGQIFIISNGVKYNAQGAKL